MKRFEKACLVGFLLINLYVLWSPWTGTMIDGPRIGPNIRQVEYGFIGYYRVNYDFDAGLRTGQFQPIQLVLTLGLTVLLSWFLVRGWPRRIEHFTDERSPR